MMTHIVGMIKRDADKMRQVDSMDGRASKLRAAGMSSFFRPGQLETAGLTRDQLPALLRSGTVERIGRGLYRLADAEPTENYSIAMACARAPKSIVCLLSALRVHGIGTQAPAAVWLGIPHKARAPRLRELRLRIVRFSGPAWTFGVAATVALACSGTTTRMCARWNSSPLPALFLLAR